MRVCRWIFLGLTCYLGFSALTYGQAHKDGWKLFAGVEFVRTYFEAEDTYFLAPKFDARMLSLQGQTVQLRGYVMPFDFGDEPTIVLSKFPFSQCFFCGAAGPESVAQIFFDKKPREFVPDEVITVSGKLQLNATDVEKLNFQLVQARIVP